MLITLLKYMYVHALMGCMCEPEGSLSIAVSMYVVIYRTWPFTTEGVAVPIIVYVPSLQTNKLIELSGQSLMWQGIVS